MPLRLLSAWALPPVPEPPRIAFPTLASSSGTRASCEDTCWSLSCHGVVESAELEVLVIVLFSGPGQNRAVSGRKRWTRAKGTMSRPALLGSALRTGRRARALPGSFEPNPFGSGKLCCGICRRTREPRCGRARKSTGSKRRPPTLVDPQCRRYPEGQPNQRSEREQPRPALPAQIACQAIDESRDPQRRNGSARALQQVAGRGSRAEVRRGRGRTQEVSQKPLPVLANQVCQRLQGQFDTPVSYLFKFRAKKT